MRAVLIGLAMGLTISLAPSIVRWFNDETARIRANQALICREGFVKLDRPRQTSVCVTGYEP